MFCAQCFTNTISHALRSNEPQCEKTCLQGFANNKGADQPGHPRSLISAFVIHVLESITSRLAMSKTSICYVVSVAEQAGLNLTLSETPKTDHVALMPKGCKSKIIWNTYGFG